MYLHTYGLTRKPFQISTDPSFLWLGPKHRDALGVLVYGVSNSRGFLLLSGGVGTGKTTLIRALQAQLDETVIAAIATNPGLSPLEFFNFLARSYDLPRRYTSKVDFLFDFAQFLRQTREAGRTALLIVDEAQRLDQTLLEEIRLLANIEDPDRKLLNVFFIGQEDFLETLSTPQNRALKQRITVNYHLDPLNIAETEQMVRHRLKIAGAGREIFAPDAFPVIHAFSRGAPRLINILCDHALLTGFLKGVDTIGADLLGDCVDDLMMPGERLRQPPQLAPSGSAPRPTTAAAAAGLMLQNAPPKPKSRRWPWLAAALLLLAIIPWMAWHRDAPPQGRRAMTMGRVSPPAAPATLPPTREPAPATPRNPPGEAAGAADQALTSAPALPPHDREAAAPSVPLPGSSTAWPGRETAPLAEPANPEPVPSDTAAPAERADLPAPEPVPAAPERVHLPAPEPAPAAPEQGDLPAPEPGPTAPAPVDAARAERAQSSPPLGALARPAYQDPPASDQGPAGEDAAAEPSPLENRLRDFIDAYCRAYESRDLGRFRNFFAPEARERGRPINEVLPDYRKTFAALEALTYDLDLLTWKRDAATGLVTLSATFEIRYRMPQSDLRTTRGRISMDLVDTGGALSVMRLDYEIKKK